MKKIISITLLFILIASICYNSFAFEIGQKDLKLIKQCEGYLKYQGSEKKAPYVVYQKDGKNYPAYCLNPYSNGIGTSGVGEYSVSVDSRVNNVAVWRMIINGFPYKTPAELGAANEEEAYTATKFAVYTALHNRNPDDYTAVDTEAGRRTLEVYRKIVQAGQNCTDTVEDNLQISIIPENERWTVDNIDSELVSKVYNFNSQVSKGTYTIKVEGKLPEGFKITDINNNEKTTFNINENFKVIIPIQKLVESDSFKITASATFETKPVLYGKTAIAGTQNYAIAGFMYEDGETSYVEGYSKNITKINIIKQDGESKNRLQGVIFNILDANKNIVHQNLTTNEKGEILLENMIPGKYYIQEVATLSGYNLYTDLIEINLELNEEIKVTVNNIPIKSTVVDKGEETIEVSSKFENSEYNQSSVSTTKSEVVEENLESVSNTKNQTDISNKSNTKFESNTTNKKLPVTGY